MDEEKKIPTCSNSALVELVRDYKAESLQLNLIHLFASEILLLKKLEIEKTKPTFIISVLKVEY